jgi:aspartyl-tRNA(Asn)/glutamyl-tRNA(Gln) amidotransferase subunit B
MAYTPTIGLEIHAELNTRTKMFCSSKNDADETKPNVNICPVCLAHPGVLPVINREAVKHVLKVGVALGGELADYTEFDRKNYFYPDLPKGYQLSQYEFPLVSGGELCGVQITRVHLEEDTASSLHSEESSTTVVDYNRAGVPLMELVTEPVIRSAEAAGKFARELQLLLRTLGVSNANMEKGEMRVEANVSVAKEGELGTKVEIKNLNSFRAMERAVEYEIERQSKLLEKGERVAQETRGWDEAKQSTFIQRTKEGSADYRYFPDPDLPSLHLSRMSDFGRSSIEKEMPELPHAKRERYLALGLKAEDANILTENTGLGSLFDRTLKEGSSGITAQLIANYLTNDLLNLIRDESTRGAQQSHEMPISAQSLAKIIALVAGGKISSRVAKDLLKSTVEDGSDPEVVAKEKGLLKLEDRDKLTIVVETVLKENQKVVDDYKAGKEVALEYLVGQGMKATRGAADPDTLRDLMRKSIGQ